MRMDLHGPHASLCHACLRLAACDTLEPSSYCTDTANTISKQARKNFTTTRILSARLLIFRLQRGKSYSWAYSKTFALYNHESLPDMPAFSHRSLKETNITLIGFDAADIVSAFWPSPLKPASFPLCSGLVFRGGATSGGVAESPQQYSAHQPPGPLFSLLIFFLTICFFFFLFPLLSVTWCLILLLRPCM